MAETKEKNPYFYWQTDALSGLLSERSAEGLHVTGVNEAEIRYRAGEKKRFSYRAVVFHPKSHGRLHIEKLMKAAGFRGVGTGFAGSRKLRVYRSDKTGAVPPVLPENYDLEATAFTWMDGVKEFVLVLMTIFVLQVLYLFSPGKAAHYLDDTIPALTAAFAAAGLTHLTAVIADYRTFKRWQASPDTVKPSGGRRGKAARLIVCLLTALAVGGGLLSNLSAEGTEGFAGTLPAAYSESLPRPELFFGEDAGPVTGTVSKDRSFLIKEAWSLSASGAGEAAAGSAAAEKGGSAEVHVYRTAGEFVSMQLASEYSSGFLEEGFSEADAGGGLYVYTAPGRSRTGLLYLNGKTAVMLDADGTGLYPEELEKKFRNWVEEILKNP